jgi:hypothetical protein
MFISDTKSMQSIMVSPNFNSNLFSSTFTFIGNIFSPDHVTAKFENTLKKMIDELTIKFDNLNVDILNNKVQFSVDDLEKSLDIFSSVIKIFETVSRPTNSTTMDFKVNKLVESIKTVHHNLSLALDNKISYYCSASSDESLSEIWKHPSNDVWDKIYKDGTWEQPKM